jgi:hypothetical protein
MAFYAVELGAEFEIEPVIVSLANKRNWSSKVTRLGKSPSELWDSFCKMLRKDLPRCECIFWQGLSELMHAKSLEACFWHTSQRILAFSKLLTSIMLWLYLLANNRLKSVMLIPQACLAHQKESMGLPEGPQDETSFSPSMIRSISPLCSWKA